MKEITTNHRKPSPLSTALAWIVVPSVFCVTLASAQEGAPEADDNVEGNAAPKGNAEVDANAGTNRNAGVDANAGTNAQAEANVGADPNAVAEQDAGGGDGLSVDPQMEDRRDDRPEPPGGTVLDDDPDGEVEPSVVRGAGMGSEIAYAEQGVVELGGFFTRATTTPARSSTMVRPWLRWLP